MRIGLSSRVLLILIVAVVSASSQIRLSPGVIVGTPLTDTLISSSSSFISGVDSSYENFHSVTKRLLIGPSVNLELPRGLGLEFDALYQRINYDIATGSSSAGSYFDQSFEQTTANRWQFPLLVQYRRSVNKANAFVEAGPSISTIADANSRGATTSVSPPSPPTTNSYTATSPAITTAGITAGGGIAIPVFGHHLRAEIRFSRWFTGAAEYPAALERSGDFSIVPTLFPVSGSGYVLSAPVSGGGSQHANEASLLLGFSF
jgi:hypothetical protein